MYRVVLSFGSSFGIAEHLLFTVGLFISIYLKDSKFPHVGFIWGLVSRFSAGIKDYHSPLLPVGFVF